MHFVKGLSIREISRRTGVHRDTISRAVKSTGPPRYRRPRRPSKLDPFKDEIHRLLADDPKLPGTRLRELLVALGYDGSKTIVDDYLREVRPLFRPPPRSYQRTAYRPGEICQFDLWRPARQIPVGFGQTRVGYVVTACLGHSRAGAGALVFSKEAPDVLWGLGSALAAAGALSVRKRCASSEVLVMPGSRQRFLTVSAACPQTQPHSRFVCAPGRCLETQAAVGPPGSTTSGRQRCHHTVGRTVGVVPWTGERRARSGASTLRTALLDG
jgi:hypothetical protein